MSLPSTVILLVLIAVPVQAQEIFDGKTFAGWTTQDGKPISKGWEIVDGMIHLDVSQGRAGNIVTNAEYEDFDLEFEWKIAQQGNNGVKYRVRHYGNRVLGLEYQLIDDRDYKSALRPKQLTASLYDLYEPADVAKTRPVGEFNHSRIVVRGQYIEHWLNGVLAVAAYVSDADWQQRKAESKFADIDGFGENFSGKIMLTDHNSEVWFRNINLTAPTYQQVVTRRCGPVRRVFGRLFRR